MRPSDYADYSSIYDIVGDSALNPEVSSFVRKLAEYLPAGARVADIGAGTGYYSRMLLSLRADISITLVEPSTHMIREIERNRIPRMDVLQHTWESFSDRDCPVSVMVFMYSLYAIFRSLEHLFESLRTYLNERESVSNIAFFLIGGRRDLAAARTRVASGLRRVGYSSQEVAKIWARYERLLLLFNRRLAHGEFCIFSPQEITSVMLQLGFSLSWMDTHGMIWSR